MTAFYKIKNFLNVAPARIYKARLRAEEKRATEVITELSALRGFVGPFIMAEFALWRALSKERSDAQQ